MTQVRPRLDAGFLMTANGRKHQFVEPVLRPILMTQRIGQRPSDSGWPQHRSFIVHKVKRSHTSWRTMKGLTLFIVGDELTEWGEKPNN